MEYNFSTSSLVRGVLLYNNATSVTQLINVNDGLLSVTPTDQPILIRNSTFEGWLNNPENLSTADQIYDPVTLSWVPVTSVELVDGSATVYDVITSSEANFVANGGLLDRKA
jgi:hypothetical protein